MPQAVQYSRRQLLRGRIQKKRVLRPPWSRPEAVFTDICSRCESCISACETNLLIKGDGGFPEADFHRGECTFCEACLTACQPQALQKTGTSEGSPWQIHAQINNSCLAKNKVFCRTCSDPCEQDAISFSLLPGGIAHPVIDTNLCNGCGACVSDCPASAIEMKHSGETSHSC